MTGHFEIRITGDGSSTLYRSDLNEVYHSERGAIAESEHVFIGAGLGLAGKERKVVRLLEVGFGTGLNAWLSLLWAIDHGVFISYYALEPFPPEKEIIDRLNYAELKGRKGEYFIRLHQARVGKNMHIHPLFDLELSAAKLEDADFTDQCFDLVYFDAFSPAVQPELWGVDIFSKLYRSVAPGGVLVTYSARGSVRRAMIAAGFRVERLEGAAGKREMLRASRDY